jgi:hypothetical protein
VVGTTLYMAFLTADCDLPTVIGWLGWWSPRVLRYHSVRHLPHTVSAYGVPLALPWVDLHSLPIAP